MGRLQVWQRARRTRRNQKRTLFIYLNNKNRLDDLINPMILNGTIPSSHPTHLNPNPKMRTMRKMTPIFSSFEKLLLLPVLLKAFLPSLLAFFSLWGASKVQAFSS